MSTSLDPIIMLWDLVATVIPRYETNSLNKNPVREHRVTIRRWTGRVNLKQQSTGIPNHQNRSFRDTKREDTFHVSQVKIVLDEVVNLFATKHPRRLELGTILRALVPQYFDVSLYIVKLLLYNLIQTVVFDKCNIQNFLLCTLPLQFLMYCYFPK